MPTHRVNLALHSLRRWLIWRLYLGRARAVWQVLLEQIETMVTMPKAAQCSIQPLNGKAPVLHHTGMTDGCDSRQGPCRRIPAIDDHPHTCSDLYVTLVHESGVPPCRAIP